MEKKKRKTPRYKTNRETLDLIPKQSWDDYLNSKECEEKLIPILYDLICEVAKEKQEPKSK